MTTLQPPPIGPRASAGEGLIRTALPPLGQEEKPVLGFWIEAGVLAAGHVPHTDRAPAIGAPPPLRGHRPWHLSRFATACRASAIVLALQGYPAHANHLRRLAVDADSHTGQPAPARRGLAA